MGLGPYRALALAPYLEQCRSHVEDDEDECKCGMSALHTADSIEEYQVSWDHEQE